MVAENEQPAGGVGPEGAARVYGPVQGPKRDKLVAEAGALVNYVAGNGATDPNVTDGAELLKELAEAVELANAEARPEPIDERWTRLVMAYEQLASVTYARWGVNGRTVLDTQGRLAGDDRSGWLRFLPRVKKRTMVVITGLLLAAVGIGLEVLVELSGMPSGASAMSEEFKAALKAVGHFAMPAAWGVLGRACFSQNGCRTSFTECSTKRRGPEDTEHESSWAPRLASSRRASPFRNLTRSSWRGALVWHRQPSHSSRG